MKRLDLVLFLSLLAAFLLSVGGFTSGDLSAGWCGLSLAILLGTINVINLLIDVRNELRRRRHGPGYG